MSRLQGQVNMTAQNEITGTRVLVAPAHIRGKASRTNGPWIQQHRLAWINSLPETVKVGEVAAALGIDRSWAGRLMKDAAKHRVPGRANFSGRGVRAGSAVSAILSMPHPAQDALEAHCARTGQTMADALVELWATVHAGEQA